MKSVGKVSVIVPVYNAAKYVRLAVESAVNLPEVAEIILVEDRSPDNALEICESLVREFSKVRLFRHPDNENRGAGASRNLGIEKSSFPYIAFLDADDRYLPHRFEQALRVFDNDPTVDAVYEAVGFVRGDNNIPFKRDGLKKVVDHRKLFHYLLRGTYGHFSTNGITLKRKIIDKIGPFNVSLRLHQDSELWLRLAFHGKVVAGDLSNVVALARIHEANRITSATEASRLKYWLAVDAYFHDKRVGLINRMLIKRKVMKFRLGKLLSVKG